MVEHHIAYVDCGERVHRFECSCEKWKHDVGQGYGVAIANWVRHAGLAVSSQTDIVITETMVEAALAEYDKNLTELQSTRLRRALQAALVVQKGGGVWGDHEAAWRWLLLDWVSSDTANHIVKLAGLNGLFDHCAASPTPASCNEVVEAIVKMLQSKYEAVIVGTRIVEEIRALINSDPVPKSKTVLT